VICKHAHTKQKEGTVEKRIVEVVPFFLHQRDLEKHKGGTVRTIFLRFVLSLDLPISSLFFLAFLLEYIDNLPKSYKP